MPDDHFSGFLAELYEDAKTRDLTTRRSGCRSGRGSRPPRRGRLIRSISHDPAAMAACHQGTQETGLPLAPVRALLVMPLDGTLSMRQLARRLGCDNSYVTPLVDALEQRGLAVRQAHPTDRRIKVIVLTDRGLELAQRVQLADTTPPAAFSGLSSSPCATCCAS